MPGPTVNINEDPAAFARDRRQASVSELPFAGRIGGNQEFTVSEDSAKGREILKKQPDAAPLYSINDSLNPNGFLVYDNYRMAVVEGFGSCLLVFVSGAGASGLTILDAPPMAITLFAALLNFVTLSLFIFAAAPASGGHLNPSVTMATFFTGLSTFPRSVIYIVAQTVGAIVGAYWLRLGLGDQFFPAGAIPGCTVDANQVSAGQLFVMEYHFSLALVFLAFGVGLDPRQGKVFGPALSPFLVGLTLGFATLASAIARPGYTGVSFNPARCMGLMVAKGEMQYHYVHWLGPLSAAMVNGLFYYFAPPYVREKPLREVSRALRGSGESA
ncbi:hypothetical protein Q7P37_008834 [Cladosporium fusiforme]